MILHTEGIYLSHLFITLYFLLYILNSIKYVTFNMQCYILYNIYIYIYIYIYMIINIC